MAAREYTVKRRTGRRGGRRKGKRDPSRNNRARLFSFGKKADRKIRGVGLRYSINYGCIYKINHPIVLSKWIQDNSKKYRHIEIYVKRIISWNNNRYIFNIKAEKYEYFNWWIKNSPLSLSRYNFNLWQVRDFTLIINS